MNKEKIIDALKGNVYHLTDNIGHSFWALTDGSKSTLVDSYAEKEEDAIEFCKKREKLYGKTNYKKVRISSLRCPFDILKSEEALKHYGYK